GMINRLSDSELLERFSSMIKQYSDSQETTQMEEKKPEKSEDFLELNGITFHMKTEQVSDAILTPIDIEFNKSKYDCFNNKETICNSKTMKVVSLKELPNVRIGTQQCNFGKANFYLVSKNQDFSKFDV